MTFVCVPPARTCNDTADADEWLRSVRRSPAVRCTITCPLSCSSAGARAVSRPGDREPVVHQSELTRFHAGHREVQKVGPRQADNDRRRPQRVREARERTVRVERYVGLDCHTLRAEVVHVPVVRLAGWSLRTRRTCRTSGTCGSGCTGHSPWSRGPRLSGRTPRPSGAAWPSSVRIGLSRRADDGGRRASQSPRAGVLSVPECEDPSVGRDQPVALAVRCGGDSDNRLVEVPAVHAAEVGRSAVGVDLPGRRDEPVAGARTSDRPRNDILGKGRRPR